MFGKIIKIHSDFYYVKVENDIYECKIREKLKKEKAEIFVGDLVTIDDVKTLSKHAVIVEILERKNYLPRPCIANIDQVIVIASVKEPELDFTQLNRYLVQASINNIPAIICINKSDIMNNESLKDEVFNIYEPLGYKVIFTCAITGMGIDELLIHMNNKVSVFCGNSGVGKSSILNRISPDLNLRTGEVSSKMSRGKHTTRHVEIIDMEVLGNKINVADTPGFSYLRFDSLLPVDIAPHFPEIKKYLEDCYFSDCLHLHESKCNVLNNMDKIVSSRYESYKTFVSEAFEFKKQLTYSGHKVEKRTKTMDSGQSEKIKIVKLGSQQREKSRKTNKQSLNCILILEDAYYNNDDGSGIEGNT